METNKGRGRSRRASLKSRLVDLGKRATAYLLCFSMALTNLPGSLILAGAETEEIIEEAEEEETYVEICSMTLDSLCDAAEDAIRYQDPMTGEEYLFAGDDADLFDAGDGLIYEAYPEVEGEDSLTLKTFVKLGKNDLEKYSKLLEEDDEYEDDEEEDEDDEEIVESEKAEEEDSDSGYEDLDLSCYNVTGNEEIIFLLINNTDEEVSARVRVVTSDTDDAEDEKDEDDEEDVIIYETSVITIPASYGDEIVYSDLIIAEDDGPAPLEYIVVDEKEENAGIASLSAESGSNAEKETTSRETRAALTLAESSSNAAARSVKTVESASNAIKINTYSDDATPMKGTWHGSLTVDGMKAAAFVTTLSKLGVSYVIETLAIEVTGDCGISEFKVIEQIDGTAPWDSDDTEGNDSDEKNNIVRSFDYVNYTLEYITALADDSKTVDGGTLCVEFTLPCGPDVASFNMSEMNWMHDPVVTYYESEDDETGTTKYENGMEVYKQVLTGNMEITGIPDQGELSAGIYIGAAANKTTLTPTFTAWMDGNSDDDKVTASDVQTVTVSAAQKYNIAFKQSNEMNIYGTYDLSTGNESAAKDTISGNTSLNGRMEGYGITVMMQNDSDEKGLKGLEFPKNETITFDLTLSETAENSRGDDLSEEAGYTPVIWDYDANLRKSAANGGSVGQWGRTWVYTNSSNMDCAYQAAPFNKLGCHTFSTKYDSCYDGGSWYMEQDETNPLVYHVTITDYTFDYEDYNFPSTYNSWYARTEPGTDYTANQACFSAGTIQMVLQFPKDAVDVPTHIYYKMVADNFEVGENKFDVKATYTNTYELVPEGSIQSGVNFTNDAAENRASTGNLLGTSYTSGDAYSFIGKDIRLWGYVGTSTDRTVRTNATLLKFDADAFEINRNDSYTQNGHYAHGSGTGKVNSFTMYFAGRSTNWESDAEMSNTLINSTDLTYYSDLDALEAAGLTCVGVLYIADVENSNNSSQSQCAIGLTVKNNEALLNNVYAACNDAWASYSTIEELEGEYGPFVTDGGKINTELATEGYDMYKAYCSPDAYATMGKSSTADESYKKTVYENGKIVSGHDVGYYGGTSLLICGEACTIEVSTDQTTYDLDKGQRTATVTVEPAVTVEGYYSLEGNTTTTTITVSVTLDEDLTYDTGSAYWGDQAITPIVTVNEDGTTTLTFILDNVTVGETLDALTFDCTIGQAGTMDDVSNNESLSVNATIKSTNDQRLMNAANGNSSTASFAIVKLSSITIKKEVDNPLIEMNGEFTWALTLYDESSNGRASLEFADVLPYNSNDDTDSQASSFNGTYTISKITIDFSEAEETYSQDENSMHFYISDDYTGSGEDLAKGAKPTDWMDLITDAARDDSKKTITLTPGDQGIEAFYCDLGYLAPNERVVMTINAQTSGNKPGDLYRNIFYEASEQYKSGSSGARLLDAEDGGSVGAVQSNEVITQVVKRDIYGRTWIDANKNGLQDDDEDALTDVTVTLYQETEKTDGADPNGIRPLAEAQAEDVYGKTVEPVTTDSDGSYSFVDLPAGNYRIEFSNVDGNIYEVTKANVGTDDGIDSDAVKVSNTDGNLKAQIAGVELPKLEDMDRYLYESKYNDAGYIKDMKDVDVDPDDGLEYGDDGVSVRVGDTLTYKIAYRNSYDEAKTITINDKLDKGLDYVVGSAKAYIFEDGEEKEIELTALSDMNGGLTWVIEDVPANTDGYVTFKATVNEKALVYNEVDNTASVQVGDDPAVETNEVRNPLIGKDVDVDPDDGLKYGDDGVSVKVGDTLTYIIYYDNPGEEAATVTITDVLDAGLDYVLGSADPDALYDYDRTLTWIIEDVEPHTGGSVTFEATVNEKALETYEVKNTASVQVGDDPVVETNEVRNPLIGKDVDVDPDDGLKYGDDGVSVKVGDTLTYIIYYDNPGEEAATVTITDVLDAGLDYVLGSADPDALYDYDRTLTWIIDVEPHTGGSVTFEATVNEKALAEGYVDNTATVQVGGDPANETNKTHNPVREYFPIDEEIVEDKNDRNTWVKKESVNEYNALMLEMSTYLPVIDIDELKNGEFTMNFHEVLDSGLRLDELDGDFSVYIGNKGIDHKYYVVTIAPNADEWTIQMRSGNAITDGCTFHVDVDLTQLALDGVITEEDLLGDTEIMIFFFADLEGTGLNGSYKSTVWYDIYDGDEWQYTSNVDVVYVYTYEIDVIKYDSSVLVGNDYDGAALNGATLGLYYDAAGTEPVSRNGAPYQVTSEAIIDENGETKNGRAVFYGLKEGTYYVREVEAPEGYVLNDNPIKVVLNEDLNEKGYRVDIEFLNAPAPEKSVDTDGDLDFEDNGKSVKVGDTLTYKIEYHNVEDKVVEVIITDVLDEGLDFVSADNGGVYDKDTRKITWTIENVPAGEEGSVTFTATVNSRGRTNGAVDNIASIQIGNNAAVDTNETHNPVPGTTSSSKGGSSGGSGGNGGGVRPGTNSGPGADSEGSDSSSSNTDTVNSINTDDIGGLPKTGESNVAMYLIGVCIALAAVLVVLFYVRRRTPDNNGQ